MLHKIEVDQKKYIGHCNKHGKYESLKTKIMGKWKGGNCPTCKANESEKTSSTKAVFDSKLPKRFKVCSFENYTLGDNSNQRKAFAWCQRYAERFEEKIIVDGTSMALTGSCGTGKTHLASSIANYVISNRLGSCLYSKVYEVMASIKSTWSDKARSEDEAIREFTKPDLLIIDEVGVQFGSPAEELLLFRLLNKRYEDMKPTIVISNLDEKGLEQYLGERVVDRMFEGGGGVLAFDWESHRRLRA